MGWDFLHLLSIIYLLDLSLHRDEYQWMFPENFSCISILQHKGCLVTFSSMSFDSWKVETREIKSRIEIEENEE